MCRRASSRATSPLWWVFCLSKGNRRSKPKPIFWYSSTLSTRFNNCQKRAERACFRMCPSDAKSTFACAILYLDSSSSRTQARSIDYWTRRRRLQNFRQTDQCPTHRTGYCRSVQALASVLFLHSHSEPSSACRSRLSSLDHSRSRSQS